MLKYVICHCLAFLINVTPDFHLMKIQKKVFKYKKKIHKATKGPQKMLIDLVIKNIDYYTLYKYFVINQRKLKFSK